MSDYFPEHVIAEILCRLPVKYIVRCTSVCKSWYSLIKSSNFIYTHLQNNNNSYSLCIARKEIYRCSLHLDNEDFEEYMLLRTPFQPEDKYYFEGSCNGLVCLLSGEIEFKKFGYNRIILWNPLIRKSLLLPVPNWIYEISFNHFLDRIGFGFDSKNLDYKVLRIFDTESCIGSDFRVALYSLNFNYWKDITQISPKYIRNISTFVNGALHGIVTSSKQLILVFNVSDEVFHEICLPECIENASNLTLKVYGESTIAVIDTNFQSDIWVMEEYGVESSWVKLATVGRRWGNGVVVFGAPRIHIFKGWSTVLGFKNNGEVLMEEVEDDRSRRVTSQKLNGQAKDLTTVPQMSNVSFNRYVESLVLLDKGNEEGGASRDGYGAANIPYSSWRYPLNDESFYYLRTRPRN